MAARKASSEIKRLTSTLTSQPTFYPSALVPAGGQIPEGTQKIRLEGYLAMIEQLCLKSLAGCKTKIRQQQQTDGKFRTKTVKSTTIPVAEPTIFPAEWSDDERKRAADASRALAELYSIRSWLTEENSYLAHHAIGLGAALARLGLRSDELRSDNLAGASESARDAKAQKTAAAYEPLAAEVAEEMRSGRASKSAAITRVAARNKISKGKVVRAVPAAGK